MTTSMASRAPTGPEILLVWNVQWLHRLVLAYTGFETVGLPLAFVVEVAYILTYAFVPLSL